MSIRPRFSTRIRPAARQQTFLVSPTLRDYFIAKANRALFANSIAYCKCFALASSFILMTSGRLTGQGNPPLRPIPPSPTLHQVYLVQKNAQSGRSPRVGPPSLPRDPHAPPPPCRDVTLACGLCPPSFSRPCFPPPHFMLPFASSKGPRTIIQVTFYQGPVC